MTSRTARCTDLWSGGRGSRTDGRIMVGNPAIADRAARFACEQVGRHGGTLTRAEVADDLG